jgi:alginate O-acetyltransferase complex protein AlgI
MSLLSLEFGILALSAVVLLNAFTGPARTGAFLAINALFAASYLAPWGIASTLALVLAGFAAARLAEHHPPSRVISIPLLTLAFVYLRGYGFLDWLLPDSLPGDLVVTAGLSFLFFKLLHVVIEAGSNTLGPLCFWNFLNYCFNFTTFLLGPIQRFQEFRADWNGEREVIPERFEAHLDGLNRVLRGLVKKFVLAEFLAHHVLSPELDVSSVSFGEMTWRAYLYYFYLYFDFSGYCDVAIGVGRLMGVRPPENFYLPFLSANVSDYWLRVHRSLTTWLTDFVFNPLYAFGLRNLSGRVPIFFLASASLVITMLVSGLWHGTTSNFVAFGLLHGAYLVGFRAWDGFARARLGNQGLRRLRETFAWRTLGVVVTFHLTAAAYVLFALETEQLRVLGRRIVGS